MEVLLQRQKLHGLVRAIVDDRGQLPELGELGSPPASFAGDDLVLAVAARTHGERLDEAILGDRGSQFFKCVVGEALAWLVGVGFQVTGGDHDQPIPRGVADES